jgi:rSAM/selenodomain-associated transferase 1
MAASRLPRLVLFAKEPAAGRVKTRLAARIGATRAADLYAAFLEDLAAALPSDRWTALLAHAEPEAGPRLRELFAPPWNLEPQGDGGLGERLASAAARAFRAGAEMVVLAGSDAPTLSPADVSGAFAELDRSDLAFAPTPDGGFSLAGLRTQADHSKLFASVRWSTAFTLADVWRNAAARGLSVALLPEIPDVDVADDLTGLRERLARKRHGAPATRALLAML